MSDSFCRVVCAAVLFSLTSIGAAAELYHQSASVGLGAPDRWDYVFYDAGSGRAFIAHGSGVSVVDVAGRKVIGELKGIAAAHGIAVDSKSQLIFADDSDDHSLSAFDGRTFELKYKVPSGEGSDGVLFEPATRTVLVIDGDAGEITAIDADHQRPARTIKVGGGLEAAVADGTGSIFVNGAERREVSRVDVRSGHVTARWPIKGCERPHGMAFDQRLGHVFVSCVNSLLFVLDAHTGQILAQLAIGKGTDAAAFDPIRRRVFSSNGRDGTMTVIQQNPQGGYAVLAEVPTAVTGRTMDIDQSSGTLLLAAADVDTAAAPVNGRPKLIPGSLKLLILEPNP